jgi:DNA modification methylase
MINKPILGDCLEKMKGIADKSISLILTDLPYETTKCSWDSMIDLPSLWIQYERIIKDNGAIVLTAQTPFDKILGISNLKLLRYEWIWQKTQPTGHLNAKKMPMKAHENVLVFYKNLPTYNPQKTFGHPRKVSTAKHKRNTSTGEIYGKCDDFKDYDSTERYPISVIEFSSDKQKLNLHSTQKPVALFEYLIKTYTNPGDLVLDSCAGSFTTAVACDNLDRNWICIEKEEKFYNLGTKRINDNRILLNKPVLENATYSK